MEELLISKSDFELLLDEIDLKFKLVLDEIDLKFEDFDRIEVKLRDFEKRLSFLEARMRRLS